MMPKLACEHTEWHVSELSRCLKMCDALSVVRCSLTCVLKCWEVSRT